MANATQNFYELYRNTSIGQSLAETLDNLISSRQIEPQLAMRVMATFDQNVAAVLGDKVKARCTFKGHLDTYRFCDEVWTFIIKDVNFKMEQNHLEKAERVKIVACQSKEKRAPSRRRLRALKKQKVTSEAVTHRAVEHETAEELSQSPADGGLPQEGLSKLQLIDQEALSLVLETPRNLPADSVQDRQQTSHRAKQSSNDNARGDSPALPNAKRNTDHPAEMAHLFECIPDPQLLPLRRLQTVSGRAEQRDAQASARYQELERETLPRFQYLDSENKPAVQKQINELAQSQEVLRLLKSEYGQLIEGHRMMCISTTSSA
ncbi:Transcription initiation factor IIA subunit 2 [Recurvomyces mirabilis]|nr:Transcription initiation factor IIA subunit 2 [Recurvomyces mirabilis]